MAKVSDVDITELDKHVTDMFKHLDNIQSVRDRRSHGKIINPIKKQFVAYKRAYDLLETDEKIDSFYQFYLDHKRTLTNKKSRNWAHNTAYLFVDREDQTMRISITGYYRYADEIMKDTMEELKGLPESAAESRTELIYPDLIELYIYRCLCKCIADKDMSGILTTIETDLGEDITTKPAMNNTGNNDVNPVVQNLMNMAGDMFKNIKSPESGGAPGTPGIANPDNINKMADIMQKLSTTPPNQIMTTLQGLYNDPEIQNIIKTVVDPNLAPEMVSSIFQNMNAGPPAEGDIPVVTDETEFVPDGEGVTLADE